MRVGLVYYSGTGNTAYLSLLFEQALVALGHAVERHDLKTLPGDGSLLKCDLLGIGSPVYHATPPRAISRFVESHSGGGLSLFTFWSRGIYAADCARILHEQARARGFRPVANFEATFPGVDFAMQTGSDSCLNRWLNMRVSRNLSERVAQFVARLEPGMPIDLAPR